MQEIIDFVQSHSLVIIDITSTLIGLWYLWLEYRASIWLWFVGVIMPAIDTVLYFKAGLYADFGKAIYYCLAALYGFIMWKWGRRKASAEKSAALQSSGDTEKFESAADLKNPGGSEETAVSEISESSETSESSDGETPITHFPLRYVLPCTLAFLLAWGALYLILIKFTNSTVPISDSFVNALSFVALWALARKYCEQWLIWLVVDAFCCALYAYKGIPFKASLYGLYTVIAFFGYLKWKRMAIKKV